MYEVKISLVDLLRQSIPNGCFDAYEVKVNKDIFKYQEKVKLVDSRFFFQWFIRVYFIPIKQL